MLTANLTLTREGLIVDGVPVSFGGAFVSQDWKIEKDGVLDKLTVTFLARNASAEENVVQAV